MTTSSPFSHIFLFLSSCLLWSSTSAQMIGAWSGVQSVEKRQFGNGSTSNLNGQNGNGNGNGNFNGNNNNNNNNNGPDTSAFNIINGRIFTPGLGIILAPQPFTPMGGDFLHIALDVSGDGKLNVPPNNIDDPLTRVWNFTMFLTSNAMGKNFTISNMTTTTPPFANIMMQEMGQTVKHINFEWPECLVGDGKDAEGTARGDYNISIHQSFRLNGEDRYTIFNLPISVSNSISRFPGAGQLSTVPPPGPLSATGGRMNCASIENPMMGFSALVQSVNNPPGQPMQDIALEVSAPPGGTIGEPGQPGSGNRDGQGQISSNNPSGQAALGAAVRMSEGSFSIMMVMMMGALVVLSTSISW